MCFRYLQLTATDIRRTTALLLKTSLSRNSAKQQRTVPYPEAETPDPSKESVVASVGVTLAQLMGPKPMPCRTKPKLDLVSGNSKTQSVISSDNISQLGGSWQIPRYH